MAGSNPPRPLVCIATGQYSIFLKCKASNAAKFQAWRKVARIIAVSFALLLSAGTPGPSGMTFPPSDPGSSSHLLDPASTLKRTAFSSFGQLVTGPEWIAYKERFIESGRIVDTANGNISHSEGQGYGMLLSVDADDPLTFHAIWSFTKRNLQIRSDQLFGWRWVRDGDSALVDRNNASDGDILIAYALIRAALAWNVPQYLSEAHPIVLDIRRLLITQQDGLTVLRPGIQGFSPEGGGQVINLSYYVYPAFRLFNRLDPHSSWKKLERDGLALTDLARFGQKRAIPDWVILAERVVEIADNKPPLSSYDAVRIPLYMALEGVDPALLEGFHQQWNSVGDRVPVAINLAADKIDHVMSAPGYRAIAELVACATRGEAVGELVRDFDGGDYFDSTLHLLTLTALRLRYPACLEKEEGY